jgi:NADH:ubiquinone oxidoreductase subunit 5 (subunit L)/multisubunit Na+/H+ antiporter MnhA subunit
MINLIWLTIALPLLGVLINGLYGKRLSRDQIGYIGAGTVILAFLIGLVVFFQVPGLPEHAAQV